MNLDDIISRLDRRLVNRRVVAAETGIPYSTLAKIAGGFTKNPRARHIDTLRAYFDRKDGARS